MRNSTAAHTSDRTFLVAVLVSLAIMLLFAQSPRAAATVVPVAFAGSLAACWLDARNRRTDLWPWPAIRGTLLFSGFALASTIWSADRLESTVKPMYLVLVVMGIQGSLLVWRDQPIEIRRRIASAVLVAIVAGLALATFEAATQQLLSRRLFTIFPRLYHGLHAHVRVNNGIVEWISDTNIKRRIGAFALLVWPAALLAITLLSKPTRAVVLTLVSVLAFVMIFVGPHHSSQIAALLSIAFFMASLWNYTWSKRILSVGFASIVMLSVPLAWGMHQAGLYEAKWVPETAKHRIVIWNLTAMETMKSPFIGVGANATRTIFEKREAERPSTTLEGGYVVALNRHAHNAYIQIWYELGAVGAMLLALAGAGLIAGIDRLPGAARPFANAQFAGTTVLMSASYGIWQMWFLASMALATVILVGTSTLADDKVQPADHPRPISPEAEPPPVTS